MLFYEWEVFIFLKVYNEIFIVNNGEVERIVKSVDEL